jgi:CRISPR/Cas system-associated endoribonuclease Cas2
LNIRTSQKNTLGRVQYSFFQATCMKQMNKAKSSEKALRFIYTVLG